MVTHPADLQLVQRCMAGDPAARDDFGRRLDCVPRIVAARNRRLRPPLGLEVVQDVAGEVVLQAWSKLADFNGYAAIESWLYAFCEFTLLNAARRLHRERAAPLEDEPAAPPERTFEGEPIARAMQRLPADEHGVVRMKHYDEMTFEAIAERLQIPLTTAKGRYYRAIERLRYWLGDNAQKEGA